MLLDDRTALQGHLEAIHRIINTDTGRITASPAVVSGEGSPYGRGLSSPYAEVVVIRGSPRESSLAGAPTLVSRIAVVEDGVGPRIAIAHRTTSEGLGENSTSCG